MSFERLNKFVLLLRKFQEADLDVVIAVTGRKGMGKSSFALQVARRYVELYFGEKYFDVKKYVAYDNSDVMRMIFELPEFSPIIADEAARFAMGEDWNKAESKEMKKIMAQIRTKHFVIFLCLPRFGWLDRKYREDMVSHWAWIPTREHCLIFEPNDNPGEPDVWHLKSLAKAGSISKFTDVDKLVRVSSKNPCFKYDVMFPKVPDEVYGRYLALRDAKILAEKTDEYVSQKDVGKVMVYNVKHGWDNFLGEVELSRGGRPTVKAIGSCLLRDPRSGVSLVTDRTIHKWMTDVGRNVRDKKLGDGEIRGDGDEEDQGVDDSVRDDVRSVVIDGSGDFD